MKQKKYTEMNDKADIRPEVLQELEKLDNGYVIADGIVLKPSQCYRIELNHLLFNTNCPESLKKRFESILSA